ncbi:cytochrome P450, family 49, subfamily A [Mytilus galloprovincialis]|uniref:Cytochrome P450, family 49, subfamily A n=1 Tax=Mytilus galloprovincialis TaxID=29158 RepID=A0A8B6C0M5_MYTGA|nr:cytochrome P450, family 49, subfamily A [Mytilus galloprovincialis]
MSKTIKIISRTYCKPKFNHGLHQNQSYRYRYRSTFVVEKYENVTGYEEAKPFEEIPGPKGLPFIGTLLQYRKGPFNRFNVDIFQDALMSRYKEYGPIMKETIGGVTAVRLFDPDFVRTMYQYEGKIPYVAPLLDTTKQYREQRNLSPGLGNTNGDEWYRLRSAVQQMMMRPKEVTVYLPLVEEVVNDFIKHMKNVKNKNDEIHDFRCEAAKWNLESSGMTCFEARLGCLLPNIEDHLLKMIHYNDEIFALSAKLQVSLPIHKLFTTPLWRKLVYAEDYFFGNGQQLVDETIDKIKDLEKSGKLQDGDYNFLTYLISRPELSYKDVSIITLSLFGDGLNTTVPTLLFTIFCLAKCPRAQEKAYKEISQFLPQEGEITPDIINKLVYLKACVKEAARFMPIGLDIKRIPQKNVVIGGYQVPAGTIVEFCNFVLFKSPDHFVDPEEFLPERWLRDGSAHNIHPYLLTPFGHGPRMCAGRRFAEQELYVLLGRMLQNFKIEWHGKEMTQKYQVLMVPDKPATFTFVDR